MSAATTIDKITLTIDGRTLQAAPGTTLLQVAREAGIEIPTLCEHPALEPMGACRLCLVEVGHPDWKGWSGLMTACLYSASAGLQVSTKSPRVERARRQVLSLLAARCPGAEEIQALAARYGAVTDGLDVDAEADACILCGLCTRVCESYATAAITTHSRGSTKAVAAFLEQPPDECVGCGACAEICPTGNIAAQRTAAGYRIWERDFATATCAVDEQRCLGCGACEEACPFAVARVALRASGVRAAAIPAEHCRGCGACVGACPTGAIDQRAPHDWATLSAPAPEAGQALVLACGRANLASAGVTAAHLVELPCTGRATVPLLLAAIARGHRAVLVLGRHQETCRLRGAEDPARDAVQRASALLDLIGLDGKRVRFVAPAPGPEGPRRAVEDFLAELASLPPLALAAPAELVGAEGQRTSLDLLRWMVAQPAARLDASAWLAQHGLPAARPGQPVLWVGPLLELQLTGGRALRPLELAEPIRAALQVMAHVGLEGAGVLMGTPHPGVEVLARAPVIVTLCQMAKEAVGKAGFLATCVDELIRERAARLPAAAPTTVAVRAGSPQAALAAALGHRVLELTCDPLPDPLTPELRAQVERELAALEAKGARGILVDGPLALVRWSLITRQGTWRSHRLRPLTGAQLALQPPPAARPVARAPRHLDGGCCSGSGRATDTEVAS